MGGVGGAFIAVPLLYWLGLPLYDAETLGLLMALANMATACVSYQRGGHIRYKMAFALAASMVIFSPVASYLSAVINRDIVLLVFMFLLLTGGSMMFFYRPRRDGESNGRVGSKKDYALGLSAGTAIGFLSGLLGIGGGILIGPFLVWRGFGGKDISGTSSLVVVCSALVGFMSHLRFMGYAHVHVNDPLFAIVAATAVLGGATGSYLARFRLNTMQIRRIIGSFEYVMAARVLILLVGAVFVTGHFFGFMQPTRRNGPTVSVVQTSEISELHAQELPQLDVLQNGAGSTEMFAWGPAYAQPSRPSAMEAVEPRVPARVAAAVLASAVAVPQRGSRA